MPNMHNAWRCIHVNTAGDIQGHVSTHAADPKPPDLPIGSRRLRPDKTDGLESCPGAQRVCIYMQSIGDSSNRPANVLVTLVLPANGAEPCMGSVVSNSNISANTSVISVPLNLQAGGTEPHTGGAKKARKPIGHVKHLHTHAEGCKEPCKHAEHVQASAWRHERLENT